MKRVSKRTHQQIQKHLFNKAACFSNTQIISKGGHFVKPTSHASFSNDKLQIICKGYGNQAQEMAEEVLKYLKEPMMTLINTQSKLNKESEQLLGNQMTDDSKQRYMVLNLIDSCFQQLSSLKIQGSCSFGMCYIINNILYIVKNKTIECYSILQKQRKQYEFKTFGSRKMPFQINTIPSLTQGEQISSKQTSGFFVCDKNYENILTRKYFPQVTFLSMKIPKLENITFLMGNSECFCNFTEDEVIEYFDQTKGLQVVGQEIIEASKKKWKTIYQEDMTLVMSRIS